MKKLIFAIAAVLCFAACNKDPEPENSVGCDISNVQVNLAGVQPGVGVDVSALIYSPYGIYAVAIEYMLNDDKTTSKYADPWEETSKNVLYHQYSGTIPGQPDGTKVSFRIITYTMHYVYKATDWQSYTVEKIDIEPEPVG